MALHPAGKGVTTVDPAGVDEVGVVPWPLLLGRRLSRSLRSRLGPIGRPEGPAHRWAVLAVILTGLFTVSVTITLLAVSLPGIARDLGSDQAAVSWSITGPMLAFGVLGPSFGKAGDLYGHRRIFVLGLLGAAVFAAATAFAWSAASLIAFRTLSAGLGSATGPSALAMISRLFDQEERIRALGYWSFTTAGAPVLGVALGGPLVDAIGWRAIFAIQAPLCLVGMVVARLLLPETEPVRRGRFDVTGAVLLGLGVTSILLAVNRGAAWGWSSPAVLAGFLLGPALLGLFLVVEHRAEDPMVPLGWLRRRNLVAPITSQALSNFAYMGGFILTPVLLQDGLGYSTGVAGLLVISRPLTFSVVAPLATPVTIRVGERAAGVTGALVVALSMVALAAVGTDTPATVIMLALALSGAGLGIASPAMGAIVSTAVDPEDLGVAGALQQLMAQIGAVVGSQAMQTVQLGTQATSGLVGSFGNAYLVGAGVAVLGAGAAGFVRSRAGRRAQLPVRS